MKNLKIDYFGGQCPVQAEGAIDDNPFYFRARGCSWSLTIVKPGGDAIAQEAAGDDLILHVWGYYGEPDDIYGAGWMSQEEAENYLNQAVEKYKNGERGIQQFDPNPILDAVRLACDIRYYEFQWGEAGVKQSMPDIHEELEKRISKFTENQLKEYQKQKEISLIKLEEWYKDIATKTDGN